MNALPPPTPASAPAPGLPPLAPWKRHLPNALTLARIALAAVFFGVLAWFDLRTSPVNAGRADPILIAGAVLFIIAASTDFLDGYLARRWKVVSLFGRVMDPFADKLLVLGAFIMLAGPGFSDVQSGTMHVLFPDRPGYSEQVSGRITLSHVAPWMAVLVLGRELLITSLRGVFESRGVSFAATMSGKLKMILQCVCIPVVLLLPNLWREPGRPGTGDWVETTIKCTVWATVAVTVWSGVPYITRALRESGRLREEPAP